MTSYEPIVIIYNPNSTGSAPDIAKRLADTLHAADVTCTLQPTDHAGHGAEIAHDTAKRHKHPLIISVSGDGGYHDIINGVMKSGNPGAVVAIEAAGNANDHYQSIVTDHLARLIIDNTPPTPIDVLKVEVEGRSAPIYGHSYVGIGISAEIAKLLNSTQLNRWRELKVLWDGLQRHVPTRIMVNDTELRTDSLICANVPRMARVLKFPAETSIQDGMFSVHIIKHHTITAMLRAFWQLIVGDPRLYSASRIACKTLQESSFQIDGELLSVPAGKSVIISSQPQRLLTLI